MEFRKIILSSLLLTILALPSTLKSKNKMVKAEELEYELVDYIDSTGEQLIDTQIQPGDYPRFEFDFMLLEDSSPYIFGSETFRLYAEGDKFKSICYETVLDGDGFVPYKRFKATIGRQELFSGQRFVAFLDLQDSGLGFKYADWSGAPGTTNVTLFGGTLNEQTIHSKVRLYEAKLRDDLILKPCHVIATDEYCLVDEATGNYYKDINGKSFVKDSLATDIEYINKEGELDTATESYKVRLDNGVGKVSGNVYVEEDLTLDTLELQGDTNLYIFDGATLTIDHGIIEKDNTAKYKLSVFGQTNQTGQLLVKGKSGGNVSGINPNKAEDGKNAIVVKTLEVNGCHSVFEGGNGGNNNGQHTPGMGTFNPERYKAGNSGYGSACEELVINRGVVTIVAGKAGKAYNEDVLAIYGDYLHGQQLPASKSRIIVNNYNHSFIGGESVDSATLLNAGADNYANNKEYTYLKIDTLSNQCPYDAIVFDSGVTYSYEDFMSFLMVSDQFSSSFECHLRNDVDAGNIDLSLNHSEALDFHGHTLTCRSLFLGNEVIIKNTSDKPGKIVASQFSWTSNGLGEYKAVKGFDSAYYIVKADFELVEHISYEWQGDIWIATAYHEGLNDNFVEAKQATYVKVSDATCTTKETGKYVLTISDGIYAGTYESDVFEVGNPLGHHTTLVNGQSPTCTEDGYKDAYYCEECGMYFEDEACTILIGDETAYNTWKANKGYLPQLPVERLSGGAIAGICVGAVAGVASISYVVMFVVYAKTGKGLKFLFKSFDWLKTLFKMK